MTSSRLATATSCLLWAALVAQPAHAALGALHTAAASPAAAAASVAATTATPTPPQTPTPTPTPTAAKAQRAFAAKPHYTEHSTQAPDGSRVQELVASNGVVFAVRWNTLYKPNLALLLGTSFPAYADSARQAALRGGIQRQFRHDAADLVVQSTGHLHTFAGYAYVRSLLPTGVSPQSLGWE